MTFMTQLEALLGPVTLRNVAGGSINQAFRAETADGPVFVKHLPRAPPGFFAAEADGLVRLAPHVKTPRVIAVLDEGLVLEWLDSAPTGRSGVLRAQAELGRGHQMACAGRALARLHEVRGERFGLERDNFMGAVPQDNRAASDATFGTFFRERRIAPLLSHLPRELGIRLEAMRWVLDESQPTLIHGDLWSGNVLMGAEPVFIDPAVCFGHPEQDLAMTRLFGGFGDAFYDAYREASGCVFDRDFEDRIAQLTLYPLLVHVALFGGSYVADVRRIVTRFS